MAALYYLLGFLSGMAAALIAALILRAKKRKPDDAERGFREILNY